MNQITLRFPDDMKEFDAVQYLPDIFNSSKNDYKAKQEGKDNLSVLIFNDNSRANFWKNKSGYMVELMKKE